MSEERTDPPEAAKSLELRLALVCYGGVSLAVYMHGVSREILNLVRASKAFRDAEPPRTGKDASSRDIYMTLLQKIEPHVRLRIIVDVIAGASAGGINGVMLARALAYDLPLASHRKMWLELADVTELLNPEGRAGAWSKPYMRPLLRLLGWWQSNNLGQFLGNAARDMEVREKLSLFTRSRWFHPPFSGTRMTQMMLDGLESIGGDDASKGSLLPVGHPLELLVTSTDFWGHRHLLKLHDPPVIMEREHRLIFDFQHVGRKDGLADSTLKESDIPSLAFAARATSCFPGAFPPVQLREVDNLLAERGQDWNTRQDFIERCFGARLAAGEDIEEAAFIDGSVLMNKPLALAIKAVQGRSANRQVDRRIVYIDPNPDRSKPQRSGPPGFFATLKGALSDIPRNQPIRDDLEWLNEFNVRTENLKQISDALTPKVTANVAKIIKLNPFRKVTPAAIERWREEANALAAEEASYAYGGYARLKVLTVLEDVAGAINDSCRAGKLAETRLEIDEWGLRKGIRPIKDAAADAQAGGKATWVDFLRTYDFRYRIRRARFVLRRINELYRDAATNDDAALLNWLDSLKREIYTVLAAYERVVAFEATEAWRQAFYPPSPAEPDPDAIDELIDGLGEALDLNAIDHKLDTLIAQAHGDCPDNAFWHRLSESYIGFSFFDVVTLPLMQWRDLYELDEVRVDRISANDANSLDRAGAGHLLKGSEMGNFAAFFSRAYRENDYLWGRLTGAERLVDIVASAVPNVDLSAELPRLKQSLFKAILEEEAGYLKHIPDVMTDLNKRVKSMI